MHRVILYVMGLLCLFLTKMYGQETESFEAQTKIISDNIEQIVTKEREKLQAASDSLNLLVQNNQLTSEKAVKIKQELAEKSAEKVNRLVTQEEEKLIELVQSEVNEQIAKPQNSEEDYTPELFRRTKPQVHFVIGYRGIQGNSDKQGGDFGVGFGLKTRIFKDNSLFYIKYGLTYIWQTESLGNPDKHYVVNGSQTDYVNYSGNLKRNSVFSNSYLRMPIALEVDFSEKAMVQGKEVYRVNRGFKFSLGGYFGYNTDSRQALRYEEDGRTTTRTIRGDWNVSHWEYGLMATVSYKTVGIYANYGLNPVFRNNPDNERMFAIGIIFE